MAIFIAYSILWESMHLHADFRIIYSCENDGKMDNNAGRWIQLKQLNEMYAITQQFTGN